MDFQASQSTLGPPVDDLGVLTGIFTTYKGQSRPTQAISVLSLIYYQCLCKVIAVDNFGRKLDLNYSILVVLPTDITGFLALAHAGSQRYSRVLIQLVS